VLDGRTGNKLWDQSTGRNEYGSQGFVAAAAVADVDGDGHDDVLAGARDGAFVAYRGRDGVPLWRVEDDAGVHASPVVLDADGDGRLEALLAWSYGRVSIVDLATGRVRWTQEVTADGGLAGIFGTPVPIGGGMILVPTTWWGAPDGVLGVTSSGTSMYVKEGRVSSSAIVGDLDGDGRLEGIYGTEAGLVVALDATGHRAVLARHKGPIEATPALFDVDGDGTYELLVASNDGLLTCYQTGARTKPTLSRFRGESPANRGAFAGPPLGWPLRGAQRFPHVAP
jgi:outer membrane protein assembly factor BamB